MKLFFATLSFLLASSNTLSQTINLDSSGVKIFNGDSIELTNIKVIGEPRSIRANFKFNPAELNFILQSAEYYEKSRYAATPELITIGNQSFSTDPNSHCSNQLGLGYRLADWKDIKNDVNDNSQNAIKISAMVPVLEGKQLYISYNNEKFTDIGYPYFLGAKDGGGLLLSSFYQNNKTYRYSINIDQILAATFAVVSLDSRDTRIDRDFTKWGVLCINPNKNLD